MSSSAASSLAVCGDISLFPSAEGVVFFLFYRRFRATLEPRFLLFRESCFELFYGEDAVELHRFPASYNLFNPRIYRKRDRKGKACHYHCGDVCVSPSIVLLCKSFVQYVGQIRQNYHV